MIALADAIFRETQHYITTDAALQAEGLIDQPVPLITVVTRKRRRPLEIGHTTVRAVSTSAATLEAAESIRTSRDGYKVTLATPAQAVADAVNRNRVMLDVLEDGDGGLSVALDGEDLLLCNVAKAVLDERGFAALTPTRIVGQS